MKKLTVHLHAELEVPDEWEIVEHSPGFFVLDTGDRFVDFDIVPLSTTSSDPDATWTDDDSKFTDEILDRVIGLDSEMKIAYLQ